MWKSLERIEPFTGSATAAILWTYLKQYLSTKQDELFSEVLCWAALLIVFKSTRRWDFDATSPFVGISPQSLPSPLLWIIAIGIASCCFLKAEIDIMGIMPALTPAILIAQNHLEFTSYGWKVSNSISSTPLAGNIGGYTLISLYSTLALSGWDVQTFALAIIPALVFLATYFALFARIFEYDALPQYISVYKTVHNLALRVIIMLMIAIGVQSAFFDFPEMSFSTAASLGLAKSLSWYFIIHTIQYSPWCISTVMETFALASTSDPFIQITEFHALSHVFTSLMALGNIIYMLPKQAKSRSVIWALFLISLAPYLLNFTAIRSAQSSASHFSSAQNHPVEALVLNSRKKFDGLLQRQSKNYTAAHDEYKRRYGIEPPPGFKPWFEFAASHQSPIIDDFDTIFEKVAPFLKISGQDVVKIIGNAHEMSGSELWMCELSGENANTHCNHPYRTSDRGIQIAFNTLIGKIRGVLPNMKFLVNHLDEPRVVLGTSKDEYGTNARESISLKNMTGQPVWDAITKSCTSQKWAGRGTVNTGVETFGLPFVTGVTSNTDLCQHAEYKSMHGLFISPNSFPMIEGLVPVLSTGSPSTMGDILFPSPAYFESDFSYDEQYDVDWENKRNNLYWTGSTTGGVALDDKWTRYHRQRFVSLAQNLEGNHYYLQDKNGVPSIFESSFLNGRLFDVAFSRIVQCETKLCKDQTAKFGMKFWQHKDQALASRLVFDIDGNGISGRYYKLLASKSVPLKQTLLREWHDDRLMPWVHYIPVSQSMKEVPELVTYLTLTENGQMRTKELAEQGRAWFSEAFREVDFTIYMYRLMLELARLQDPKRRATK